MSVSQLHPVSPASRVVTWPFALVVFLSGLLALALAFTAEGAAAIATWENSTAYNHCWLVLPVAAWLAWTRRHQLFGLRPSPTPLAAVGALLASCAWLVSERLGVMEGRQLAVIGMVWCLFLGVFGWRIAGAQAGPLLYLVFLVPFGAFLVPTLQRFTAWFIVSGLEWISIPHYHDDLVIEIPEGTFLVAEACAGLRFVVAALAFGAVYALAMFRSPWRRLAVMVLALVVPVVANGVRAFGIVLLGHVLGSAEAAAADHLLYGWVFFSLIILLLVVAGLPFREDTFPDVPQNTAQKKPTFGPASIVFSAVICCSLSLAAPALAIALDRVSPPQVVAPLLSAPAECRAIETGQKFLCGTVKLSATVLAFSPRTTWSKVSGERRRLSGEDDEAVTFNVISPSAIWHVRQDSRTGSMVAVASWLGGKPAGDGLHSRIAQALNSLQWGTGRPVNAAIAMESNAPTGDATSQQPDRAWLRSLLEKGSDDLTVQAIAMSR
jgi:exosortase A